MSLLPTEKTSHPPRMKNVYVMISHLLVEFLLILTKKTWLGVPDHWLNENKWSSFIGCLFLSNAPHPTNERCSWLSVGIAIEQQVPGRPHPALMVRHTAIGRVAPAKR